MTKITCWGVVAKVGGVSANRNRDWQLEARSFNEIDRQLPTGLVVDYDHDQVSRGQVCHVELGSDDILRAVAVLDDDTIAKVDKPVYFSGTFDMRHCAGDSHAYIAESAKMIGLSLTFTPANHTAASRPVQWHQGDYRTPGDWPISWRHKMPLVARALEQRSRTATRIAAAAPTAQAVRDGWLIRSNAHGEYVLPRHSSRPHGEMRYSTPVRGSILQVR